MVSWFECWLAIHCWTIVVFFFSTPEQLFNDFDMSEMAFLPGIPAPKKAGSGKGKTRRVEIVDADLKEYCSKVLKTSGRRGLL